MTKGRHDLLRSVSVTQGRSLAQPSRTDARPDPALAHDAFDDPDVTYNLWGRVQGTDYPSPSPVQQDEFTAHFARELASLKKWCAREQWLPSLPASGLRVFVSDEYKISKSLMPAALGPHCRMENS